MLVFDHIGIRAYEPMPDEDWIESSKVWVTNPRNHPESIEFLRYEPDSAVTFSADVPQAGQYRLSIWYAGSP